MASPNVTYEEVVAGGPDAIVRAIAASRARARLNFRLIFVMTRLILVGGLVIDAFSRFGMAELGPRVAFLLAPAWLALGVLLLRPVDERRREGDGPPGRATPLPSVTASGSAAT